MPPDPLAYFQPVTTDPASCLTVEKTVTSRCIDTNAASQAIGDLQAAFSIAGTPTLLASLWSIETNTARELITRFFGDWQRTPIKNASNVLATAIREYLQSADLAHQHPRFWAPFEIFGYGGEVGVIPARQRPNEINAFRVLPHSTPGEVIDVQSAGEEEILSMSGDWNGKKYAGIVAKVSARGEAIWKSKSYEVGAGSLALYKGSVFAAGYVSSERTSPVLRRVSSNGEVEWEKRFPEMKGRMFSAIATLDDGLIVASAVEHLDELREIHQRAAQPVDLVDHHDVDGAGFDVSQEPFERRALQVAA